MPHILLDLFHLEITAAKKYSFIYIFRLITFQGLITEYVGIYKK